MYVCTQFHTCTVNKFQYFCVVCIKTYRMTTLFVVLFKFNMELQKNIYFFGIIKTLVEEKNFIKI